jgi:hypothetical protein
MPCQTTQSPASWGGDAKLEEWARLRASAKAAESLSSALL